VTSVGKPGASPFLEGAGAKAVKENYKEPEPVKKKLKTAPRSREWGSRAFLEELGAEVGKENI
jgi:hypothetical protein